MQAFLWAAHAVYAGAQIATATLLRDWHPLDELKPVQTQADANKAAAAGAAAAAASSDAQSSSPAVALSALEQAQRSGRSLPLTHARSRPGLVLQLACALLALLACTRVLPQAGRELRVATAAHFSSAGTAAAASMLPRGAHALRRASPASASDAVGPPGARNAPQHAEDLIPVQRGGRRTVREIMEQDVAHLLPGRADPSAPSQPPQPQPQAQALKHGRVFSAREQRAAGPGLSFIRKEDDGSALGGVVFHALGLLLSLFHWCFYAGWSRLNPQRRWSAPAHLALSRRASTHFRATTAMGLLMALVNTLALYCLLRAGTDSDWEEGGALAAAAAQEAASSRYADHADPLGAAARDVASVSPTGLLTALCYFPYFMLHVHRFALNVVLCWRFRSFFPRVGTASAKRRGKRAAAAAAAGSAPLANQRKQRAAQRRRAAAEEEAAAASDAETAELDLSDLASLASYAPDFASSSSPSSIAAALALDPSGDSLMAPSPLMEKLRYTPKLEEIRVREQRERKKAKELMDAIKSANKEE